LFPSRHIYYVHLSAFGLIIVDAPLEGCLSECKLITVISTIAPKTGKKEGRLRLQIRERDDFDMKSEFLIEGRAARPNFDLTKDSRFFVFSLFTRHSLPVCATLEIFVHVSNPFCTEHHCLHYQNIPNTSFDLAVFCKTVQASISKDAKMLHQFSRPNFACGAYAFVTAAKALQNPFKFVTLLYDKSS
jgi:hypothetical protein